MGLYSERIFPWIMERSDPDELKAERYAAVSDATGQALEIGVGTGANFAHYPSSVTAVTAVEPSSGMNHRARRARAQSAVPVRLVAGDGQSLPFASRSFDTVLALFVLCTIADPDRTLSEARRVLKPDGRLLFLEHVSAPEPGVRRWQRRLEPIWKRIGCGCHLTRDTESKLSEAGFEVTSIDRYWLTKAPRIVGWVIRGSARVAA
ncbi:MAG: class I SAM-dependent methyltransferase [Gemmatimonadota bacterium]